MHLTCLLAAVAISLAHCNTAKSLQVLSYVQNLPQLADQVIVMVHAHPSNQQGR